MCPCDDHCGKALEVCECSDAAGYIKELTDLQAKGLTAKVIRDKFVEKYGPTVLASPPAKGFGLLVYVAPPLLVVAGFVAAVSLSRRWRRRSDKAPPISPADVKRAEEALKQWKS